MRLSAALLTLLSTAYAQELPNANKLRGADLTTQPKTINHATNGIHLDASTRLQLAVNKLSVEDDASDLAECTPHSSPEDCNSDKCTWCVSKAVSSACYPTGMTGRLPAGVFECSASVAVASDSSGGEKRGEMVASRLERMEDRFSHVVEEVVEKAEDIARGVGEDKKIRSEFFNLKEGVTLTLSSDAVDKEFCDPNSDVSLAGYMTVKGSQFDTNNDKNLFFWMFEKRTTSLIPTKNNAFLKEGWNWPCFFNCDKDETNETPTQSQDSTDSSSSSTNASEDDTPLVVWLTGGPGCSSSLALLTENGPCSVNEDGESTTPNPHSWTESAHVLWLDQPAEVGYSYGQGNDYNEEMISEDAYYFLQAFFKSEDGEKYKNSPLFIVGESYGGHYAPAIAHRIWRGNKEVKENLLTLNLQGLAVGNGITNPEIQYQYYSEMAFKNSHNIQAIDQSTYDLMKEEEPVCVKGIQTCNSGDGMVADLACQAAHYGCEAALTSPYFATGLNPYDMRKPCGDNPLCYDFSHVEKFMNQDTTKRALHVDSHDPSWQTCNNDVNSKFNVDKMKDFSGYVADLVNDDIRTLIYAGDVDFICNYLGNKAWTTELEWKNSAEFKAAEDHDWNNNAGLAKTAGSLTFLQVYDAGHMVPTDQPEHALTMITQFLNGVEF